MYYKITNQSSKVYQKLHQLRTRELEIEEENKKTAKAKADLITRALADTMAQPARIRRRIEQLQRGAGARVGHQDQPGRSSRAGAVLAAAVPGEGRRATGAALPRDGGRERWRRVAGPRRRLVRQRGHRRPPPYAVSARRFVALDLRGALDALGDITGATTTDDILDHVFSQFCIGK